MLIESLRARFGSAERFTLATGSVAALAVRVTGTAATLLLQVYLVRLLGVQQFGDYMYVTAWVGLLALTATLGLDTAALRFVAEYSTQGDSRLLHAFLTRSLVLVGGASVALSLAMVATVAALGERLSPSLAATFHAAALLLPALSLLLLVSGVLRGLKRVVLSVLPQWLLRPLLLAGVAWLLARLFAGALSAAVVTLADGVLSALLFVSLLAAARRNRPAPETGDPPPPVRRWLATSLPLLALTAIRMSMNRVDIVLVGALLGTAQAGIYAAPAQIAILITFGLSAVNMIAAPLFAELRVRRQDAELQRVVTLGTRSAFAFSLLLGAGLLVLGPFVLRLYGPEFAAGYAPLVVLVVSHVIGAGAGSVGFLLSMTGNERTAAWITAWAGLLNLVLNALLIPPLGLVGAALGTGLANVAWTVALVVLVRRRLGLRPTAFGL
ncbi:MAG TPA: oligosaccharide flippase family protein [Thermoanaerobaculia bacterium]|nr:oligosaccharide flippase family protein [Thermoanaerobaculia bacterium]